MKRLLLLSGFCFLFSVFVMAQKVEFEAGKIIQVEEITSGFGKGNFNYMQDGQKLKYRNLFKALETIEACSGNMEIARKYRNQAITMATIGLCTFPVGYLILAVPIMKKKESEDEYLRLAIEDYNKSLQ